MPLRVVVRGWRHRISRSLTRPTKARTGSTTRILAPSVVTSLRQMVWLGSRAVSHLATVVSEMRKAFALYRPNRGNSRLLIHAVRPGCLLSRPLKVPRDGRPERRRLRRNGGVSRTSIGDTSNSTGC
jgi:hypothetical protein